MNEFGCTYGSSTTIGLSVTVDLIETKRLIEEAQKLPIEIIETALKQAGYNIGEDFDIEPQELSEAINVRAKSGHRLSWDGVCQIHGNVKGRMNVFWTYEPMSGGHNEVDIILADPKSLKQLTDAIVAATNACRTVPLQNRKDHWIPDGKITI